MSISSTSFLGLDRARGVGVVILSAKGASPDHVTWPDSTCCTRSAVAAATALEPSSLAVAYGVVGASGDDDGRLSLTW